MQGKLAGSVMFLFLFNNMLHISAQQPGIYKTQNDYDSSRLSFVPKGAVKYRINSNDLLCPEIIKIRMGDTLIRLHKDSVYGYKDEENSSYRIYKQHTYRILNPGENILLYSRPGSVSSKGIQPTDSYYFSTASGAEILPLTKFYLKRAYPDNTTFHELLDAYFDQNTELLSYDAFYKMFKINRALELSRQCK